MPHSNDWKEKLTRRWNTANLMGLQEQIAFIESLLLSQKQELIAEIQAEYDSVMQDRSEIQQKYGTGLWKALALLKDPT